MADERVRSEHERQDFIGALARQRGFLVQTVTGLSEEQARRHPTVSALSLGGLIKHVTRAEQNWTNFITQGTSAIGRTDAASFAAHVASFDMADDETVSGLLERYAEVAQSTEALIMSLPSLEVAHPLPDAPWFEPGASWTARRTLLHLVGEIAQHAGHADIIRESIDGATSMG
jgi:uncharacterized damage-inducible protein DinB